MPARAQAAGAWPQLPTVPVVQRIGPSKRTIAEMRAELPGLLAERRRWLTDPVARFVLSRRIAFDYYDLLAPDSAYYWLHQARKDGAVLPPAYGADINQVAERLANFYTRRAAYDSAYAYYGLQIRQIRAAGLPLADRVPAVLLEGPSDYWIGRTLAQAYANAGLTLRRRGDLIGPVRYYDRALRHFQLVGFGPGLVWAYDLLGEASEEQGNDTKAIEAYANALRAAYAYYAAQPLTGRLHALEAVSDALQYYEPLLLRQGHADQLLAFSTRGLAMADSVLPMEMKTGHTRDVLNVIASLRLHAAQARVANGQWMLAAATLDQATADLRRLSATCVAVNRHELHYHEKQVRLNALRAVVAQRSGDSLAQAQAVARARGYLDSLIYPSARLATTLQLATHLSQMGQSATATALLAALVPQFRQANNLLKLRDTYQLLAPAYAGQGQHRLAYQALHSYIGLTDSLRATQQYATLADVETRYRTRQQAYEIGQLQARSAEQRRQNQLAWLSALLLLTLLGGVAWVLRNTRRLNRRLAEQRRQLELQAEQLTELDRAKSAFFANVSHELRTPLTLIVGPVEQTLQQAEATWAPATLRERLTLMLRSGRRLQSLVNGLLDLSKLDAGRLEAHPALVQAASFFGEQLQAFAPLAEERQVSLTGVIDLPDTLFLFFDADKAEKVITNLLVNALKFTPAGGQVTVGVGADDARPEHYYLTVQDTGPGIARAEQARVFERFYQSRVHGEQGGTGIGLALARELAELLGGSLTLASEPGAGSTFTFTFRAAAAAPPQSADEEAPDFAEETTPRRADGSRPRVLVVEDNADLRTYLRHILTPAYEVLEAEHGRQALAILAENDVDLISSDAMMPELDGMALLARVREHPQWRRRPFLMLTARAATEHRLAALELGVDDYLPKPFLARELLARVRNLLTNYYERLNWQDASTPDILADEAAETAVATAATTTKATAVTTAELAVATGTDPDPALLAALQGLVPAVLDNPAYSPALLATALGVSERSLYRKLKEQTGLTPAGWLREVRLDHARHLLETRALATVAEVAYAAGFQDPNYFGQAYNKRFGRKPSEY